MEPNATDVMSGGDGEMSELISDASSSEMNGENWEFRPPFEPSFSIQAQEHKIFFSLLNVSKSCLKLLTIRIFMLLTV